MGLTAAERKQLANILYNHVEEAYANRQDYREFLDHLIEQYEKAGHNGIDPAYRATFLELIGEVLYF